MELLKALKSKQIAFCFLILLFAAGALYLYEENASIQFYNELRPFITDEVADQWDVYRAYEERQIEYTDGYADNLAKKLENGNALSGFSIFQNEDSYSYKNIQKTRAEYEKLLSVTVSYGDYEAVEQVLSYDKAGYVIFLFAFFMILFFMREEKIGLRKIFYITQNGRGKLAVRQMLVLILYVAVFSFAMYLVLLGASIGFYGMFGDWGSSAQSMILLEKCTLLLNIWEYLLFFVCVNTLLAIAAALFVWMWMEAFTNRLFGLLAVILIGGVEAVLYFCLDDTSVWVCLKYINIFRLIYPGDILYEYRNFNLGGTPVNCLSVVIVMAAALIVISFFVILLIREKRRPVSSTGMLERRFAATFGRLGDGFHRINSRLSTFGYELYKMLIVNKGILFLALWICVLFMQLDFTEVNFIGTRAYINAVYEEYQGEDDGRFREFIEEKEEEVSIAEQEYEDQLAAYENGEITQAQLDFASQKYQSYSMMIEAVAQFEAQIMYVDRIKEEQDITAWVVNERPYKILWTKDGLWDGIGYGDQEFLAVANLLLIIFLISSVFPYDRICGMYGVIRCTRNGRKKLFHKKAALTIMSCVLVTLVSYGLKIIEVNRNYPLNCLGAPIQSLRFMEDFPLPISIAGFLCLEFLIHAIVLAALALMVCEITYLMKGIKGTIVAVLVLAGPQIFYMLGFDWCYYLSLAQPLIFVEILNECGFYKSLAIFLAVVLIGIGCGLLLKIQWCGKGRKDGIRVEKRM